MDHRAAVAPRARRSSADAALRARMRRALGTSPDHAALARMGSVVAYLLEAATNPALLAKALLQSSAPSATQWPPQPIPAGSSLAEKVRNYGRHEVPAKFE